MGSPLQERNHASDSVPHLDAYDIELCRVVDSTYGPLPLWGGQHLINQIS